MSSREYSLVRSRGSGVLSTLTKEALAKWHPKCDAFRNDVAGDRFTGGAFIVGEAEGQGGFLPLFCVRGNTDTLAMATVGMIHAWVAQSKAEGTPVTKERLAQVIMHAAPDLFGGDA